ncbi:uncharacterized protein LOC127007000 [Eriocheir sinensis]|uniref:uncharacterized protein LOC127007000 n=1 Tax=Eriocheir sinensis TaxID=95602 RepID=UPI0021C7B16E|nr:uncharacterized protein LOC127007000 [Eriocheir sinensis]XP_050733428.1 uncharacterized protein LOC127007000 [Eriocheir sinensis]XP_050733430.1 uncharacterized protein LOC127007000 [Eriocheir sinensis]
MRITMRLTRVLTLLMVLAVVMMMVLDAAEADRENRRRAGGGGGGGGSGQGRRGGRGGGGGRGRRLPLRGLEKCLCGRDPETPDCTNCFDRLRNNTITDWANFGECLNNAQAPVPTPGFNSTCVPSGSPRRHR